MVAERVVDELEAVDVDDVTARGEPTSIASRRSCSAARLARPVSESWALWRLKSSVVARMRSKRYATSAVFTISVATATTREAPEAPAVVRAVANDSHAAAPEPATSRATCAATSPRGSEQTVIGRNHSAISTNPDGRPPPAQTRHGHGEDPDEAGDVHRHARQHDRAAQHDDGVERRRREGEGDDPALVRPPACGTSSHSAVMTSCTGHAAPSARVRSAARSVGRDTATEGMAALVIGRGYPNFWRVGGWRDAARAARAAYAAASAAHICSYSAGERPTTARKSRMKCAWSKYPRSSARRVQSLRSPAASCSAASWRR